MSDQTSRLKSFLGELKRRRVFRVAIVYAIAAFAVLEGTSNLTSALNLPGWINTVVAVLVILGFPTAMLLAWVFDISLEGVTRTEPRAARQAPQLDASARGSDSDAADSRQSIAVLPFVDMSPEKDQQYFGDGIAEEIINALTKVDDLRVVARTSAFAFKGMDQDIREIGDQLSVSALLEGSVRTAGSKVRITAQLINVSDGYHLWSERYDREMEDVFAIQDEIAHAIVGTLKVKLMGAEDAPMIRPGTAHMEAYTLYLKGRYHWMKRTAKDIRRGIEYFERAITLDESYALAYAGLADSYSILGWYRHLPPKEAYVRTEAAATKAVAIDDSLAEAYTSLAYAKFLYSWDWEGAESDFKSAIQRNPEYPTGRHWYGEFLMAMGRFEEALEQVSIGHALDPLALTIGIGVGWAYYYVGDYDAAIEQYQKTLEQDPSFVLAPWFLGSAFVQKGMYQAAIEVYTRWMPRLRNQAGLMALLGFAHASAGERDQALQVLSQLEERAQRKPVPPDYFALIHTGLGDVDRAFEWLDRALEERVWYLVFLKVDPAFASLRSDPRFDRLLKGIGLDRTPARAETVANYRHRQFSPSVVADDR